MAGKSLSLQNARPKERASNPKGRLSEHREKGLWSFLTWSFFLSQIVGVEQAAASAAQADGAADNAASANDPAGDQAATGGFLPLDPAILVEAQEAATGAAIQGYAVEAAPVAFLTGLPGELSAAELGAAGGSPDVWQTGSAPSLSGAISQAGVSSSVANPGGDAIDDVIQVLDPVVEQVVAPVVGIVGDLVGDVVQVLDPVIEQVVAPVIGIAGDLVGDVVQALAPVVETLDPVVDQVLAPLANTLGSPLASLLSLGSGAPIFATPAVVASSGSIDFEGAPATGGLSLDDLFSGGGYTDYSLALQASAGAVSTPGAILHDAGADAGDILGAVTSPSDDGHGGHGNSHHIGVPSILEEIGLRGSGDGFAL